MQSVLQSDTFRRAQVLRRLLRYLWDNRDREISEYAVGTEVLGRRSDFDPKADASVRVQVARLREKLEQYYLREGRGADLQITIPVGTHRPVVAPPLAQEPPAVRSPGLPLQLQYLLAAVVLMLAGVCLVLLANRGGAAKPTRAAAEPDSLPPFWKEFASGGKPVHLVLPTPAFLQWELESPLVVRDYTYNEFANMSKSPLLRDWINKFGPPGLSEHYSVTHDAEAAVNLAAYLSWRRVPVHATTPGHLEQSLLEQGHRVFFGNARTVDHLEDKIAGLNFQPDQELGVRNLRPQRGEPPVFRREFHSRRRQLVPGLIVFRSDGKTNILLLLSENTKELVTFLTSAAGLASLEHFRKPGQPWRPFELVVVAELDADRVLRVRPTTYRVIGSRGGDGPPR